MTLERPDTTLPRVVSRVAHASASLENRPLEPAGRLVPWRSIVIERRRRAAGMRKAREDVRHPELPCVCRDELLCRAGRSVTSITSSSSRGDRARRVYFSPTRSNGPCASTQGQGSALLQARGETHRSGVGRHPIQSPYSVIVPYSCRLGASSSRCTSRARVRIETGKLYTTLASRSVTWNLNNSSRRQRVRGARILDAALLWESNLLRAYLRRILGGRHEV